MSNLTRLQCAVLTMFAAVGCEHQTPQTAGSFQPTAAAAQENPVASPAQIVASGERPRSAGENQGSQFGLTRKDLDVIQQSLPNLRMVVPVREIRREARFGEQVASVPLVGTVAEYAQSHQLALARGRFLTDHDLAQLGNVAVIGDLVARQLFLDRDPVGKSIRIGEHYFTIVGVLRAPGRDSDDLANASRSHVYVPISTMRSRLGDREVVRASGAFRTDHFELSRIELTVDNPADLEKTAAIVERLLKRLHQDAADEVKVSLRTVTGAEK